MDISISTRGKAAIIAVSGDLDFNSYKEFATAVECSLAEGRTPVVIEISNVPHIDSMGLGTLTKYWKQATSQDMTLCIAGARKNVQSMINLVNLDKRIKLFATVDEALV